MAKKLTLLSQTVSHTLRILAQAAARGEPITTKDLARKTGLTQAYVFKIAARLSATGLMISTPGRSGGVRLARAPDKTTLADVMRALSPAPEADGSPESVLFGQAIEAYFAVLDRYTLDDVSLAPPGQRPRQGQTRQRRKLASGLRHSAGSCR